MPMNADGGIEAAVDDERCSQKHGHIKILVGGKKNTWMTLSELSYAQRVEGHNEKDELSTMGQVYGRKYGVAAPQEP